jgi:hypothetical protein
MEHRQQVGRATGVADEVIVLTVAKQLEGQLKANEQSIDPQDAMGSSRTL